MLNLKGSVWIKITFSNSSWQLGRQKHRNQDVVSASTATIAVRVLARYYKKG